jgi:hypothetical protein
MTSSGARRNEGGCQDRLQGEWPRSRAPFIELRWRVEEMGKRRWSTGDGLSKLDVFEVEEEEGSRGGVNSVGGMKAMRHRFISFSRAWKRAADGDARCGSVGQDDGGSSDQGGRNALGGLGWAEMGRKTQPILV